MRLARLWPAPLCALPVLTLSILAEPAVAQGEPVIQRYEAVLRLGPPSGPPTFVPPDPDTRIGPRASNFDVDFGDGFNASRRAAFNRAIAAWQNVLNSPVKITVATRFENLGGAGLLGIGGSFFRVNISGLPRKDTWFSEAVANKRVDPPRQIDSGTHDVTVRFNSNVTNFHFGEGKAPAGTIDFTSVAMHELGHGLAFAPVGASATTLRASGFPGIYSRFTELGNGTKLLSFNDGSNALEEALTSDDVFFDSKRVRKANNDKRAKLFAPSTFQSGSSYGHLDEATYPKGNKNSLMTPTISTGETIRAIGPITKAMFKDMGW